MKTNHTKIFNNYRKWYVQGSFINKLLFNSIMKRKLEIFYSLSDKEKIKAQYKFKEKCK